jgi:hypothetical protein
MNIEIVRNFLLWCTIINFGMILVWFLFFVLSHNWTYSLHSRWFRLTTSLME